MKNLQKIIVFSLCLILIFSFTSCKKKKGKDKTLTTKAVITNPLTGEGNFSSAAQGKRPISISINNAYPEDHNGDSIQPISFSKAWQRVALHACYGYMAMPIKYQKSVLSEVQE